MSHIHWQLFQHVRFEGLCGLADKLQSELCAVHFSFISATCYGKTRINTVPASPARWWWLCCRMNDVWRTRCPDWYVFIMRFTINSIFDGTNFWYKCKYRLNKTINANFQLIFQIFTGRKSTEIQIVRCWLNHKIKKHIAPPKTPLCNQCNQCDWLCYVCFHFDSED